MDENNTGNINTTDMDNSELPKFVKAGIAYLGIMAGLAILGLFFYVAASRGESTGSVLVESDAYATTIAFFTILVALSLIGLYGLVKRLRLGVYVALVALVLSMFAPSGGKNLESSFAITWWLGIPNTVVGILLIRSLGKLR